MHYSKNFSRRPRIVATSSVERKKLVAAAFNRGNPRIFLVIHLYTYYIKLAGTLLGLYLQKDLDAFIQDWNTHLIRRNMNFDSPISAIHGIQCIHITLKKTLCHVCLTSLHGHCLKFLSLYIYMALL